MVCGCTLSRPVSPAHRWWCWPTAFPNWPTPGATRSRCSPPPATTCWLPISAATAAPPARRTSPPTTSHELTADLVGLLDDVGAERRCWIGHDWGAQVVWSTPQLHPDRVAAVVGLSVPPLPRAQVPPTQAFRAIFGDNFFYMLYFQEPGSPTPNWTATRPDHAPDDRRSAATRRPGGRNADGRPPDRRASSSGMPEPDGLPDWISQDELDHYIAEFTRTGFTGGLNWYRNMDRNWEIHGRTRRPPPSPCRAMFIGGTADPVLVSPAPTVPHRK